MLRTEFEKYFQDDLSYTVEEKYIFTVGKEKKKFFISDIDER
jgi:hypothetical protein